MSDKEKRRSTALPSGMPTGKSVKSDGDHDFLAQAGVGDLLLGAILKMVEARSDDPIGFLADHFCNLASVTDSGSAAGCGEEDPQNSGSASAGAQEQQRLNRALWHLRLAHHSQRHEYVDEPLGAGEDQGVAAILDGSPHFPNQTGVNAGSAFSNNVRVAYDLLNLTGCKKQVDKAPEGSDGSSTDSSTSAGGGVRGGLYTQTLQCLCSEGGVPASTFAPLLRRLCCHDHEAVPCDVFRYGVLTCAVFSDYIRQAQRLYAEVCCPAEGPASRRLCLNVLGTLKEALETSQGCDTYYCVNANTKANTSLEANLKAIRYLQASAKISPLRLAQTMAGAQTLGPGGDMDAKEFEDAAAELFIARVKFVS
ncbi:tubulin polyglutamylase complex subunit 1 isoform X1 [Nothobranchius furzeri]|uniref:Tubulin polyglutamylase complex subunit 1 n=1 Tax=Nothobranchius furzeri TaxID=105023 RepID=A0A8C6PC62_NOTFU